MCFQKRKCYPSTSGVSFRKKLIQHAACGVGFWRMGFTGVKKQTFLRSSPKPSVEYRQQKWSLKYFLRSWAKILSYWIVLYFIFPFIAPKHSFLEEIRVFSIAFFFSWANTLLKYSIWHKSWCWSALCTVHYVREICPGLLGWVFVSCLFLKLCGFQYLSWALFSSLLECNSKGYLDNVSATKLPSLELLIYITWSRAMSLL